jgi:FkbM family methyltransferase
VKNLKYRIRKVLHSFGFDIVEVRKSIVQNLKIETLFDVGANAGQYAMKMREEGYAGTIVSFEPLSDAHMLLQENSSKDSKWLVHDRCAIGERDDTVEINISGNSKSSSLLPMLETHSKSAPSSTYIGKELVDVIPLSSVFDTYRSPRITNFLKIDTQGFEHHVLAGIENNLESFVGVQLELSMTPLYEGSELYPYFFDYFDAHGFDLWDVEPGFSSPDTGRMLQFDAIFVNRNYR